MKLGVQLEIREHRTCTDVVASGQIHEQLSFQANRHVQDLIRVNAKSRGGGEAGLPETSSSGGARLSGMEQIHRILGLIRYG